MGLLSWALKYRKMNLSVLPVESHGKQPLIKWAEFQKRIASENEIREWFHKWPDANLGIITGKISDVVIVDLDGLDGIAMSQVLGLQTSIVSITGRGKHLWYRNPIGTVENAVKVYPGIDIRGEGGFVLAPPSVHPNGKRYRWMFRPVISVKQLPMFPQGVFANGVLKVIQDVKRNDADWISTALGEMKNGNIDDTLFKICARLRNDSYSKQDTYALLAPHAERVGATDGHLRDKIDNVWNRYEPKQFISSGSSSSGQLVLHSPANLDSRRLYEQLQLETITATSRLTTGYTKFDQISKGLKAGEILTVAARTGVGKTNWIIGPIRNFCKENKRVLLFSTEMSFDQIWQRYRATLDRQDDFGQHMFYICDEFTPNIERIEEAIKNVRPDLFIFDHISHIGTDYHIISKFMSEIKRLVRLYNIPAIVTAQLNRNADYVEQGTRIEPRLSMIQGSDQIGQMSAQVLLLNEKRINADVTEIEGIIVKNRHGDKGLIQFGLLKNPYRIEEI